MAKKKFKLKSPTQIKEALSKNKETKNKTKKKRKKRNLHIGRKLLTLIVFGLILAAVSTIAFGLYIVFTAPEFTQEALYNKEASVIYFKDGSVMTRLGSENRVIKSYEEYPQVLVDALIATEDSRFFQHNGLDAARFIKATLGQFAGHSDAGGASTLSMQLAKNNFNGSESSGLEGIIRKFKDIYMAVFKIEKNYTKEEIIEMYLNSLWFAGGDTNTGGIYGVEQASKYFFNKSVSDLTLPEAAMLVGMVNNPTIYSPYIYPEYAEDRKDTVLSLMNRHGYITEEEMKDAQNIDINTLVVKKSSSTTSPYQVLVDYVKDEILDKEGIDIYTNSYNVYTTFDRNVQDVINNMQNGAATEFRDELVQVGVAVTSISDGSISGLGPGRHYVAQGDNRATTRNQPGSTIKPLIDYGPLIEYNNASSSQMFLDVNYTYNAGGTVNNWDMSHKGAMTMKDALSASRNVTAVQAYQMNNKDNIKKFLNGLGIDEDNYGSGGLFESFAIGGLPYGLSPLESSAAYAAFSRGGDYITPYSYTKLENTETQEVIEFKPTRTKAMSKETAWMVTDMLLQATREGVGGNISYNLRGTIASKSGTTNISSSDASAKGVSVYTTPDHWVNTYNSKYAISMWYGYDKKDMDGDHYLTSNSGTAARGAISAYLANNILTTGETFNKPDSVIQVSVEKDLLPLKKSSEYTPESLKATAYFKSGTEPAETSKRFSKLDNPSNVEATKKSDTIIRVTWDAISGNSGYSADQAKVDLANYFKDFKANYPNSYQTFETAYLNSFKTNLSSYVGELGYIVTVTDPSGNTTTLNWTKDTSLDYKFSKAGKYTFSVKASYSILKTNQSSPVTTTITIKDTTKTETEKTTDTSNNTTTTTKPKTGNGLD